MFTRSASPPAAAPAAMTAVTTIGTQARRRVSAMSAFFLSPPGARDQCRWPTDRWHWMHGSAPPVLGTASIACTMSAWQERHADSVMARLRALMRIGSWKRPVVNANECQNPLRALVAYLGSRACGVWQSLHAATARWLEAIHPSYCSRMMWQLAHAAGSFIRYEAPRAYTKV